MALGMETITKQINNTQKQNNIPETVKENPMNMVTIERTKAENFLIVLEECIGDIEEQKNLIDKLIQSKNEELEGFQSQTISKFNALIEATSGLSEKIAATESYENYLAEQVRNANLSKEVAMLEQQLQKEKAEISKFIISTDNFITTRISDIESTVNELKSVNNIIEENIQKFKEELKNESSKAIAQAENQLTENSDALVKGASNQFKILREDCNTMLKSYTEKCQQHLDTVKKQSIDFLKQCEVENKKLIEKVPAVANSKFSKKDVIIYVLAGVSIASLLVQIFV